jgi:hypothetical protein
VQQMEEAKAIQISNKGEACTSEEYHDFILIFK